MNDGDIVGLLDELTPTYDGRVGDWGRVVADARRPARLLRWRVGVFAVAVAAAAALVLSWPFGGRNGTVLDRALAAVGNGPVMHATLRGEWGGTLVDLSTGARSPVYGEDEIWFDNATGRTHEIERLGGVVQDEEVFKPNKPEAEFIALGREYRQALETGTARIAGEDSIDGEPVVWITIHSELLPDVADGRDHEWAQQVAVSQRTYRPVALREMRDGRPTPETLQRVLNLELIARDPADFSTSRPSRDGTAFRQGREQIAREQAPTVLGRTPLWLGAGYDGLPLAQIYRETTSAGRRTNGDIQWTEAERSVVFFYGTTGAEANADLEHAAPDYAKPYVALTESTRVSPLRPGAGSYVPPEGAVFIAAGGQSGYLQRDGVQIAVDAGSESAVLAAARRLLPMR